MATSANNPYGSRRTDPPPPPVPPVPASLRVELESEYGSPPHFEDPLAAPRPQRLQPDLPANMARTLQEQASSYSRNAYDPYGRARSPQPPYNLATPGLATPGSNATSPPPSVWNPWSSSNSPSYTPHGMPQAYGSPYPGPSYTPQPPPLKPEDVSSSLAALSLTPQPPPPPPQDLYTHQRTQAAAGSHPQQQQSYAPQHHHRTQSAALSPPPPPPAPQASASSSPPSLIAPLPTVAGLTASLSSIRQPDTDPTQKIGWCRDVLALVNRAESLQATTKNPTSVSNDAPVGPVRIGDPQLQRLVEVALPLILEISSPNPMPKPTPVHISEAIYLKATCESSGAYPHVIRRDPRTAFRDFEYAARHGYPAAWFKIGRDYENFGDVVHARDAFERGVKAGDERCLYRMGMANLMGQLQLPPSAAAALPLLNRAATLATVDVPQPAYVYGLLLLEEFSHITIPPHLFAPYIPQGSSAQAEARKHLERAAYLNFAPAQYKLGHSYEFATPPFPFDALLSVQYYSLASQQGETEADMALSKWFLCGSEGAFEKDEGLALTFAEKAANKGLPNAEFAMGYYAEVGVGGPKDIATARMWYAKAAGHGNADAEDRLKALSQPAPQALSRAEHDQLTDSKLVRTRTQAKQRSDATGGRRPAVVDGQSARIVENVRKTSSMIPPAVSAPSATASPGGSGRYFPSVVEEPSLAQVETPPRTSSNSASPAPGPVPPQPQTPRPFANAPRYNLSDPGAVTTNGPRPPPSQPQTPFGPPRREGRPTPTQPTPTNRPDTPSGPKKGPATFAEMGITTAKVEEKDCVIM
ncbi:HCP-like protein [Trametopsis cervina]|nr:HCP-like protein [Trametopsis cervina]